MSNTGEPHKYEVEFSGTKSGFRRSLTVYINKPHVVNRRLCGAKILYQKYHSHVDEKVLTELKSNFCEADVFHEKEISHRSNEEQNEDANLEFAEEGFLIIVRDLIPRQIDKYPTLREIVHYDATSSIITFQPLCHVKGSPPHENETDEDTYKFAYIETGGTTRLQLKVESSRSEQGHVTTRWLEDVLLTKLARWGSEKELRTGITSLKLVPVDDYNNLYNQLKVKYGNHFVEIWPETTDPKKFVYEDVAIATYLLLIWRADRERKKLSRLQSFVDLGCGNGLLVHILASEGHPGIGIDIRRRKIWEIFGDKTILKEQSIIPSADNLFPEYDWLIGNHSDELTPWIPLMAARSSYTSCYFVLPCCLHDFDSKFSGREKNMSPYRTYLNFVKEVGDVCGFQVEEDTLRIPSTKRVCFIGRQRTYTESEESLQDEKRTLYVQQRCSSKGDNSDSSVSKKPRLEGDSDGQWASQFQPREEKEPVRNCQRVPAETKQTIINSVFKKVLEADDSVVVSLGNGTQWRKGGSIPLSEIASMFSGEILQQLKAENGGLQTLLRNHHRIFQVSGGVVKLRDFTCDNPWSRSKKAKSKKNGAQTFYKTSLCWFHDNHPDGCPRTAETCDFAHGAEDLKSKDLP